MSQFLAVHPVLPVRDVLRSMRWYGRAFGFETLFLDDPDAPAYLGLGRDGVEVHLQLHGAEEWEAGLTTATYRFLVDHPDQLLVEARNMGGIPSSVEVYDTPWGTREFACFDPDKNGLTFYRNRAPGTEG